MMPFLRDIRFGFRAAVRSPGFAVVAVVTLAIGIGATTALFSVINAVLFRSFGYADIGRLVEISGVNQQGQSGGLSSPDSGRSSSVRIPSSPWEPGGFSSSL